MIDKTKYKGSTRILVPIAKGDHMDVRIEYICVTCGEKCMTAEFPADALNCITTEPELENALSMFLSYEDRDAIFHTGICPKCALRSLTATKFMGNKIKCD